MRELQFRCFLRSLKETKTDVEGKITIFYSMSKIVTVYLHFTYKVEWKTEPKRMDCAGSIL